MLVDTRFVSHALPMSQVYQGEINAPCPYYKNAPALLCTATKGNKPFWLNLHVADVGHTVILGPTGSGKSTLVNALIMAHRKYRDSRIVVLDKDQSHKVVIRALGGAYFDLSNSSCQLAPFSEIKPDDKLSQQQAVSWLSEYCSIQGIDITPEQHAHLRDAVLRLANEPPEFRNLSHLSVQDPSLRQAIDTYAKGGYHHLLNGTQTLWKNASVLGFAMDSLINHTCQQKDPRIPVIKALFNNLETLFVDRHPTLLCLPEGWAYLKHPLFKDKLIDWFKTLRKFNVAVIFDSQDLSDIAQSNTASIIQNACMTRIYLPNAQATQPTVNDLYQQFGLNERQIELLQLAQPKQDYYYTSPKGNRLFSLDLGELAQRFLCLASKEDLTQFEKICDPNSPQWILTWLKHAGLNEWHDYVANNYFKDLK